MKNFISALITITLLSSCKSTVITPHALTNISDEIQVNINLNDIRNDKVLVTIKTPTIFSDTITFSLPKMVPGTYSEDNYGKFIDDLKAYDKKGHLLLTHKTDENSWVISNSKTLDKITYFVNDTFDIEKNVVIDSDDVFSPTGSNIDAGKNIVLNTHCFIGYFKDFLTYPYKVNIAHPEALWGASSMNDLDTSTTNDLFVMPSYSRLVENPILYAKPNFSTFTVDGMDILVAVYSPTDKFTAESFTPELKTMITAQKHFLGNMNTTKKYSVLLYLSTNKNDANGFGALEHPTATTVVFPEIMSPETLIKMMKVVVSHEFFHNLTPLTIHSEEIQNFDYSNPKMSKHLWMYEGVTEYFSNLFQINQGLISEDEFYLRIDEKIKNASLHDDTLPFTTMSKNVLVAPYKSQYLNVYEKGALIGMCLDIVIREKSNGERGILDLMQKLSKEYGVSKAFKDDDLFKKITELTYPEVGDFLKTYVDGSTPIPYETYLAKVGVAKTIVKTPKNIFDNGDKLNIAITNSKGEIIIDSGMKLNLFLTHLGLQNGDIILTVNHKNYTPDIANDILYDCENWKENDSITLKIRRNGLEIVIKGTVKIPFEETQGYNALDSTKAKLKEAWLKG